MVTVHQYERFLGYFHIKRDAFDPFFHFFFHFWRMKSWRHYHIFSFFSGKIQNSVSRNLKWGNISNAIQFFGVFELNMCFFSRCSGSQRLDSTRNNTFELVCVCMCCEMANAVTLDKIALFLIFSMLLSVVSEYHFRCAHTVIIKWWTNEPLKQMENLKRPEYERDRLLITINEMK